MIPNSRLVKNVGKRIDESLQSVLHHAISNPSWNSVKLIAA